MTWCDKLADITLSEVKFVLKNKKKPATGAGFFCFNEELHTFQQW